LNIAVVVFLLTSAAQTSGSYAQNKYDVGASDTEVKLGQTMPYSGPVSVLSVEGRVQAAYYAMLNEQGGINGRKVKLISLDDAYSPPKTVEQTRRLVEQDEVLAIMGSLGTPTNLAIRKYLNQKKVPHLLVLSSSAQWNNPKEYPYSMSFYVAADEEATALGRHILATHPDAQIGILYQNDDYGKDYIRGLRNGLGDKARQVIVRELSHEVTDPTIDSQIANLKAAGADVFVAATTSRFAALAIRKINELNWKPARFLAGGAIGSLKGVIDSETANGLTSISFYRDPSDPKLETDVDGKEYFSFMAKHLPRDNAKEMAAALAYVAAQVGANVIAQCGNNLTRENLLRVASHLHDVPARMLLEGVTISTSPDNYLAIKKARLVKFDGESWVPFGEPIEVGATSAQPAEQR
jgi:ABC-type branched-subunit amino acid transport system substrate-binding protein